MKPTNIDDSLADRRAQEEALRRLLKDAGPRDEVPEEDLTAIKRVASREWNEAVVSEQRRVRRGRWQVAMAAAAGLTAVAVLVGLWWSKSTPVVGETIAVAELIDGRVMVADAAGDRPLAVNGELTSGDVIRTSDAAGAPGRIAFRLASGHSARLDRGSEVELAPDRLVLRRGAVYVDSGGDAARVIEVATDRGVVREIGTQFEVRVEDESAALRVRVREGEVGVQAGAAMQTVAPGEELVIDRYGGGSRNTIPLHGHGWDWILEIAPVPQVDGLTLHGFLDWFSRETGLVARFEDSQLEAATGEVLIHGSITGMTPSQALNVVLAGSDLAYAVDNGTVLVRRR